MRRGLTLRSLVASGLLLAIVVAGFFAMGLAVRQLQSSDRNASRSADVLATANALEKTTIDLETGLRGYLLAGQSRFLAPFDAASDTYRGLSSQLSALTQANAEQHARAQAMERTIGAYINDWARPLIARGAHDLRAARRAEAGGGGKHRVDAIRRQFAAFTAEQNRLADAQARHANHVASLSLTLSIIGMVVCGLLVLAMALGMRYFIVEPVRRLAGGIRRVGAGELSVRIAEGGTAEIGELTSGFNAMAQQLEQHHDELENQKAELEAQQVEIETAMVAVEEQKAQIELMQHIVDELAAVSQLDAVAEVVLRELADTAAAEMGAIYVQSDEDGVHALVGRRGLARGGLAPTIRPGQGLPGRALAESRPVLVSAGEASLRVPGLARDREAVHELHLPLRHGEQTIGVVSLGRVNDHSFLDEELKLLTRIAQRAAVTLVEAISRHRLEALAHEMDTVLSSTGEGIYGTDRNGCVTLVNRAALEQTGYTREEFVGQNSHQLLHHTRVDGSPYPQSECPLMASIGQGQGRRIEGEVFWRKDGTSFPVEYSSYPIYSGDQIVGAVVTFLDVSSRAVAERQRDVQHAVTRVLAEAQTVEEALPGVLREVCARLDWALGIAWQPNGDGASMRKFAVHSQPGFESDAAALAEAGVDRDRLPAGAAMVRRAPMVCERADTEARIGSTSRPLHGSVAMPILALDGQLIGVAEFFSEHPVAEPGLLDTLTSLAGQTAQFIARKMQEFETERMRQEFVATVSHELRTPLTAIDGWLHVLLSREAGPLTEDQERFLTTVKRNSDRLIRLVGDLLLARQIESGQLTLELEDVDMGELAREAVELVSASAAAKRIDLRLAEDENEVLNVRGDRARLMQLLGNLLTNAVKFTPEGGQVSVEIRAEGTSCSLRVADTGIGIPPEDREHLFERFFRASSAREHGVGGTGLGLAISKAIAESHGGDVRLSDEDAAGRGSVFIVELPLAVREELPL